VLLLKIAESKPEWQNARLAQILALNTTMRGCEIKGLRWRDVDLIDRTLTVVRVTTKTDRASASFLSMRTRQELS
jgi:integrase